MIELAPDDHRLQPGYRSSEEDVISDEPVYAIQKDGFYVPVTKEAFEATIQEDQKSDIRAQLQENAEKVSDILSASVPLEEDPFADMKKGFANLQKSMKQNLNQEKIDFQQSEKDFWERKEEEFQKTYARKSPAEIRDALEIIALEKKIAESFLSDDEEAEGISDDDFIANIQKKFAKQNQDE